MFPPQPAVCFFPGKWGWVVSASPVKPGEMQGCPGQTCHRHPRRDPPAPTVHSTRGPDYTVVPFPL